MKIDKLLTDETLLRELGARIAQHRVDRNITQAAAAREAGVGKRTLERLENGDTVQLTSFLRVLRVLDLLEGLEVVIPEPTPSPYQIMKMGKRRQRASKEKPLSDIVAEPKEPWTWNDDD